MDNQIIKAMFTDNAEEEVKRLVDDIQLSQTFEELKTNSSISPELRRNVLGLIAVFSDLFSANVPDVVDNDLDATLETASRDINLSRLLRERGLFRIFRLIKMTKEDKVTPIYIGMINPLSGEPFGRMEDLIGYFCEASHVSRSLVFQRLATIERCLYLGMDLEKAFKTIVSKPYAIAETLHMIGDWDKGELVKINPEVAQKLVDKFGIPQLNSEGEEIDIYQPNDVKDAIMSLLDEVAAHDRVKDVLDFVRHDVLKKPEINYKWEKETDALVVELVRKEINKEGKEYIAQVMQIPFYPDIEGALPKEIRDDLVKRLPMTNKTELK